MGWSKDYNGGFLDPRVGNMADLDWSPTSVTRGLADLKLWLYGRTVVSLEEYEYLVPNKTASRNMWDWTIPLQTAIKDIMLAGGGTLFVPAGDYSYTGTVYTHLDEYDSNSNMSPLQIVGETSLFAEVDNSVKKNVTRFIKRNAGSILGTNYTTTKQTVVQGVWRNLTVRNIGFWGTATYGTKYTKVVAYTTNTVGIEMSRTSITLEDCGFYNLAKGVKQSPTIDGSDNYCDQSVFRRLCFRGMGTGWIELQRSDATTIENINGYDMAVTCEFGIYARKGESFSAKEVLIAGKAMHLADNFKLFDLFHVASVKLAQIYAERVEGLIANIESCKNVKIENYSQRQYAKTIIKARNVRNLTIDGITSLIEEGKELSSADTGDYTTYSTIPYPYDIDVDATCYSVMVDNCYFEHGVHGAGDFVGNGQIRLFPRMPKTAQHTTSLKSWNFTVYTSGSTVVAKINDVPVQWEALLGTTAPTYDAVTGELTFAQTGLFGNKPSVVTSKRRSPTGVVNDPVIIANDPLKIRLYKQDGSLVPLADIGFTMQVKY
jgi:hypothetical protein